VQVLSLQEDLGRDRGQTPLKVPDVPSADVDNEARLRRIPPGARADLLRVLESDAHVRADVIRQFHERPGGHGMAEVLMDVEEDDLVRFRLIALLRDIDG
jgi:hypothetical protein